MESEYFRVAHNVLENGRQQQNRTGIEAISIPGEIMRFDLKSGYPLATTKSMPFKGMRGELLAFMRGYDNAADFRKLGCMFWDQNANENQAWLNNPNRKGVDDLGRVYGVQWRRMNAYKQVESPEAVKLAVNDGYKVVGSIGGKALLHKETDHLLNAIKTIITNPTNRRIIIDAWKPDEFDQMALPPCHVLYEFIVNTTDNELNLCMFQRSCDMFLGVPVNIASASLLLSIVAKMTGYTPRFFTHFLADTHFYREVQPANSELLNDPYFILDHTNAIREQMTRTPGMSPTLILSDNIKQVFDVVDGKKVIWSDEAICRSIEAIEPDDIQLEGYNPAPAIKAAMAV